MARVLAFVAILLGGLCGGVIGAPVVDVQCTGDCDQPAAVGGLLGAVTGASGVAVVSVLALRAMGEWRTIEHGRAAQREYEMRAEDGRSPRLDLRPGGGPPGPARGGQAAGRARARPPSAHPAPRPRDQLNLASATARSVAVRAAGSAGGPEAQAAEAFGEVQAGGAGRRRGGRGLPRPGPARTSATRAASLPTWVSWHARARAFTSMVSPTSTQASGSSVPASSTVGTRWAGPAGREVAAPPHMGAQASRAAKPTSRWSWWLT